jgi:SecD/SecF fusion protein
MPTNHLGRLTLIAVILFGALACIFPGLVSNPAKLFDPNIPLADKLNLRPGIDMVGGVSLLYEIKAPPGSTANDLATQMRDKLKQRIDPDNFLNAVWVPDDKSNRLEITIPRTVGSANSEAIRNKFSADRAALEKTNVRLNTVMDAIDRFTGAERQSKLKALAGDSATRLDLLNALAKASDDLKTARAAKDAAAQANAEITLEATKPKVEATNIDVGDLQRNLDAIVEAKIKHDNEPKEPGPSQELLDAVQAVRDQAKDFPSRAAALDAFIGIHDDYYKIKNQFDQTADIKRELQGSGILEFHILVPPGDPRVQEMLQRLESGQARRVRSDDTCKWAQVDKPDSFHAAGVIREHGGYKWVLLDLRPEKSLTQATGNRWALRGASPEQNQRTSQTEVAFQFDTQGGIYFGRLTGGNINSPMAILLDDKVISAPNINSQITERGTISGNYDAKEITYLVNTLNAGSLPAQLAPEPISERSVGSTVGADNLHAGLVACGVGLLVVVVFLFFYYHLSGVVASLAVVMNLILILAVLAGLGQTFTLPGIAALILTLGTAVDANVLIFERLREEQHRGFPLRTALRNAYDRAFTAIFDSNVVTVIVSLVLYLFGSEDVKGFGITLLIGILASLFTALYVTKTIFAVLIDKFNLTKLGSFPQTFPAWDRLLKPHFDWMGKLRLLGAVSVTILIIGLGLFVHYLRNGQMLDIEFASGTSVTVDFKQPIPLEDVRKLLDAAGTDRVTVAPSDTNDKSAAAKAEDRIVPVAVAIPAPTVVPVGDSAKSYEIITPNADVPAVRAAILDVFRDKLDIRVPSTFDLGGKSFEAALDANVVIPVASKPPANLARFPLEKWPDYIGGVAIQLSKISPPMSPAEMQEAINAQRLSPGAPANLPQVVVLGPGQADAPTTDALILAVDTRISADEDHDKWQSDVAGPLWRLTNDAITKPPKLAKISSFNAQVAGAFQQDALISISLSIVIIMGYVWLRFGSLKYGWANTLALLHDTLFIIAALGYSHAIVDHAPRGLVDFLRLEPFRINLTVVAGVLTIMAYSMVDTIVVFDRIREIRGPRGILTRKTINDAINQTLSRTLLTAGTTIATLFVMYLFGGAGIHGFTYVLLIGILVGTYSSVVIAAPMLLIGANKQAPTKYPSSGSGTQLQKA